MLKGDQRERTLDLEGTSPGSPADVASEVCGLVCGGRAACTARCTARRMCCGPAMEIMAKKRRWRWSVIAAEFLRSLLGGSGEGRVE